MLDVHSPVEAMSSFISLDFENFSEPAFVCRKPSIDFGGKRMVGSPREGQIHISHSPVRSSWAILEWFEAAEA